MNLFAIHKKPLVFQNYKLVHSYESPRTVSLEHPNFEALLLIVVIEDLHLEIKLSFDDLNGLKGISEREPSLTSKGHSKKNCPRFYFLIFTIWTTDGS